MANCGLIETWTPCLRKWLFLICCPHIHHSLEPIFIHLSCRQVIKERLVSDLPGGRHDIRRCTFWKADGFLLQKPEMAETCVIISE